MTNQQLSNVNKSSSFPYLESIKNGGLYILILRSSWLKVSAFSLLLFLGGVAGLYVLHPYLSVSMLKLAEEKTLIELFFTIVGGSLMLIALILAPLLLMIKARSK